MTGESGGKSHVGRCTVVIETNTCGSGF